MRAPLIILIILFELKKQKLLQHSQTDTEYLHATLPTAKYTSNNNRQSKGKMPPSVSTHESGHPLLERAGEELGRLRDKSVPPAHGFPNACHSMLVNIEGNNRCIDCGASNPQWATVKYGALLCLQCSGRHRSLGVQVSSAYLMSSRHVFNLPFGEKQKAL